MSRVIVCYVVNQVHLRNLEMIAMEMPDWTFRVTYEAASQWLNSENTGESSLEAIALPDGAVPDALWSGDVRAVIFSTAQARRVPIDLLASSLECGVPTIAIEESNTIAWLDGTVVNYVLPVDHLLVASSHERQGMIEAGVQAKLVEVTGWPFYSGPVGRAPPDRSRAMKERFGLDPDRPVATLTLVGLDAPGEVGPQVRRRLLSLAADGLPAEYQLVVKPHPIVKREAVAPVVSQCAPSATLVDGAVPIEDVLDATDVLLNRGQSQICIEALLREIPVIVLDTGVRTPFHGIVEYLVVGKPIELTDAIGRLSDVQDLTRLYAPFTEVHVPYPPREARELTCRRIAEIAADGCRGSDRAGQWFDLAMYQAWQVDHDAAVETLSLHCSSETVQPAEPLRRLMQFRATRDDLDALKRHVGKGLRSHVLRCLWIDQLHRHRDQPTNEDLEWMQDFPPRLNTTTLLGYVGQWMDVLDRSGHSRLGVSLARRLEKDFKHVSGIAHLIRRADRYDGAMGRAKYFLGWAEGRARGALRPVKRRLVSRAAHRDS